MSNVLRESLISLRAQFYLGCLTSALWVAGLGLLFSVSWKIGLGIWLSLIANDLHRKERKA